MEIDTTKIIESLRSHRLVDGLTHNLYSYPARFSPELAREIIRNFSSSGDWIFDPFMGGGTSVVEALAAGRSALGVDINSLAWFVTLSKTTPLSSADVKQLRDWSKSICSDNIAIHPSLELDELRHHFPRRFLCFLDGILANTTTLKGQNAKRISRFVSLRTYQDLLNDRDGFPSSIAVKHRFNIELEKIISGLREFIDSCGRSGIPIREIVSKRRLLNRSSIGIESDKRIRDLISYPRLVFTSPPYPGVHVLYNKWQIASRKETFLPYYISGMNDSRSESYYTLGGRSKTGMSKYFGLISQSFSSIAKVIHPNAIVAQLVGFSDTRTQLPLYLRSMEEAGYKEIFPISADGNRLWRDVPNRKWYTNGRDRWDASKEVLLFHVLSSK
jgi:DNA methylase